MVAAAFWLFLLCSLSILLALGGKEGRLIAIACISAAVGTFLANSFLGFTRGFPVVFATDVILLSIAVAVALESARFWPLWFGGFELITVACHIAKWAFPATIPQIYTDTAGFWSLPALTSASLGIILDRNCEILADRIAPSA